MIEKIKKFINDIRKSESKTNYSEKCSIITPFNLLKFSKLINHFPIHGRITDDDIIPMSHKLDDGKYETCFIRMKELKTYLKEK